MMVVKILLSSAILLSALVAVSGLQCFVCNSYQDPTCGDPFYAESAAMKRSYLITCNNRADGMEAFCRKTKTYIARTGEVRIHRECGYYEREGRHCYQQRTDDYITDICQCRTELCNSAASFGVKLLVLTIPLCLSALL